MNSTLYTGQQFKAPSNEKVQIGKKTEDGLREVHYPEREATANTQLRLEKSIKRIIESEDWEEVPRFTWNSKRVQCPHCNKFMMTSTVEGEPFASCVCGSIKTQDELLANGKIEENY